MKPLVTRKELNIRIYQSVLIRYKLVVILPAEFVVRPQAGLVILSVRIQSASPFTQ